VALARSLGADAAIDCRRPGWEREVWEATGGLGADVAFDGVGGAVSKALAGLVKKGGRYVVHGFASGEPGELPPEKRSELEVVPLHSVIAGPEDEYDLVERALAAAAAGSLAPVIGQIFPLEQAARAHALIEAREALGKTLLSVRGDALHPDRAR